jgi:Protein of unknown function (DUF4238)
VTSTTTTPKKRIQHYVWKAYLKPWARSGSIFLLRDGVITSSGLKKIASELDFYKLERLSVAERQFIYNAEIKNARPHLAKASKGWLDLFDLPFRCEDLIRKIRQENPAVSPGVLESLNEQVSVAKHNLEEDLYAKVEAGANKYLAGLRRCDAAVVARDEDWLDFTYFLCLQYMRTAKRERAALAAAGLRFRPTWQVLRHILASKMSWVMYAERSLWRLAFLESPASRSFVTGDQPILNTHAMEAPPGQEPSELELFYPLSPKVALLITDRAEVASGARVALDNSEVDSYNGFISLASLEQIYGNSREILATLRRA